MISRDEEARRVLASAELLHDQQSVDNACAALAAQITERCAGRNPLIMPVMMGGMFAASEIMRQLEFPFEMDYLHASRYRNEIQGSELIWKVMPTATLENRVVVVIDDILDEGHTLKAVEVALQAQSPTEVIVAVLVDKQTPKRAPGVQVDMVGLQVSDRYVFGCGMDYKGYWRQLPAIYAVAGTG
jgi:hypoxanthine phosphoribosyltransferase